MEKSIELLKKLDEPIREGDEEKQGEVATEVHTNKREALSPEPGMTDNERHTAVDTETESHNTERAGLMQDAISGFNNSNDKNPTHDDTDVHIYQNAFKLSTALSHQTLT